MANISVLGRLTRNPQQRQVQNNTVVSLDIAENTGRKDQQGNDEAVYYQASVWGQRGQTALQYLHKGDPVYVYGNLIPRQYQGRDGSPRTALDVNNASFQFVPRPPRNQNNGGQQGGYQQPQQQPQYQTQGQQGGYQQPQPQQYQQQAQQPPQGYQPMPTEQVDPSQLPFNDNGNQLQGAPQQPQQPQPPQAPQQQKQPPF